MSDVYYNVWQLNLVNLDLQYTDCDFFIISFEVKDILKDFNTMKDKFSP